MIDGPAITAAVAEAFGLLPGDIRGRSRARPVVRARAAACWMLRTFPAPSGGRRSLNMVKREVRRSDHSSIVYLVEKADDLLCRDAGFAECMARAGEVLARRQA